LSIQIFSQFLLFFLASLGEGYVEGLDMALPLGDFFGLEISINITWLFWVPTKLLQGKLGCNRKKKRPTFQRGEGKTTGKFPGF